MVKTLHSARTGACRWLVTAGIFVLVGSGVGDAQAQDRAKDAPAELQRVSVDATARGNVYFDDFDRDDLGDKYSLINSDPNRLTLSDGKLLIVGTHPPGNTVLLNESFSGDFVATMIVAMELSKNNFVGLRYHVDEENYLVVGINGETYFERRRPYLSKMVGGKQNVIDPALGAVGDRSLEGYSADPETWYFQLRREGFRYTGLVSADGVRWTRIGTHVLLQPHGQLGFTVGSGGGIETAAEFNSFSVQQ